MPDKHRTWVVVALMLLSMASPVVAETSAREHFQRGVDSFNAGDVGDAVAEFEAAQRGGLDTPSLWYNLGVAYYREADFSNAGQAFSRLLKGPNADLARYNLGLVVLAFGEKASAQRYFVQVRDGGGSEKLKALAQRQLDQLTTPANQDVAGAWPWSAAIGLTAGYDSNLALVSDAEPSFEGGHFLEGLFAGSVQARGTESNGVRLEGALYGRRYGANQSYNTDVAQLGIARSAPVGDGVGEAAVRLAQSWLASDPLERELQAVLAYRWDDCLRQAFSTYCKLAFSAAKVDGGAGYEAYDGQRYGTRFDLGLSWSDWDLGVSYRLAHNRRRDYQTASEYISVSPQHHDLRIELEHQLSDSLIAGVRLGYRYSRYQTRHQLLTDTGILTKRRIDQRVEPALLLEYPLSRHWSLTGEWEYQSNQSTLDRYEYRRQVIQGGIEGTF